MSNFFFKLLIAVGCLLPKMVQWSEEKQHFQTSLDLAAMKALSWAARGSENVKQMEHGVALGPNVEVH